MRIDVYRLFPEGSRAMFAFEKAVAASGLEPTLLELLRMRASQVNACAYCIDMHTKDALAAGESDQRLHALSAWRDTPFFSERERAALALSEAVTRLEGQEVPDEVLAEARRHFTDEEVARIVFAVVAINAWNRLNLVARPPVGDYRPKARSG
jgi:AhpD family alkylhydroperoxidase